MMQSNTHRLVLTALVFAGLAASCGPPDTFEREQMLKDTTDEVILQTHATLSERTDAMTSAVETLCQGDRNTSELQEARSAWRDLQEPLKHIQAWSFNMSPYRGSSYGILAYKIDREPSWGDNIEAVITQEGTYRQDLNVDGDEEPDQPFPDGADTTIDQDFIAQQDYRRNAKGYPAVEYLLFGEKDGTGMGELYQSGDHADRRCDYLLAANAHAAATLDAYVEAWARDGGNFAGLFDSEAPNDMDWTTVQDSIDALVSQMVFVAKQRISKNLLGGPLGQHTDNANIPDDVSSPHANASIDQILMTLDGLESIYQGAEGKSLADYTRFRQPSVHRLVTQRIQKARTAIEAIPEPLSTAVNDNTAKVEAAQTAVDKLSSAIEADLKTTLGASTTKVVVDND
jgi:hypothetical protein